MKTITLDLLLRVLPDDALISVTNLDAEHTAFTGTIAGYNPADAAEYAVEACPVKDDRFDVFISRIENNAELAEDRLPLSEFLIRIDWVNAYLQLRSGNVSHFLGSVQEFLHPHTLSGPWSVTSVQHSDGVYVIDVTPLILPESE